MIRRAQAYDFKAEGDVVPTIEGLSIRLGVSRATVYTWIEVPEDDTTPQAKRK